MNNKKTVFDVLSAVDVSSRVQKKGKLTYLSWAWAWGEVAKRYPDANYEVYRNPDTNLPYDFVEGSGYMAYTTVTIEGKSLSMWLPVINYNNKSILSNATTFDINKTLMRCLTKNLAMHGLGHYIYAGEDLPETPIETTGKVDLGNKPKNFKVDLGDDDFDAYGEQVTPTSMPKAPTVSKKKPKPTGDFAKDIIKVKEALAKGSKWEDAERWLKSSDHYDEVALTEFKGEVDA